MKKYWFVLTLLFIFSTPGFGQQVLLEKDVREATETTKWGPNLKYFLHGYVGFGLVAGAPESSTSPINYGSSHDWYFGMRFKLKIARFYALGLETYVNPQTFSIKQKEGKNLPSATFHDSERLRFTNIGLGAFNRFNYGKRGNHVGNYIDLGVYGNWLPFSTHFYQDALNESGLPSAKEVTVKLKNLNYLTTFQYGATARVGFNWFVLYGTYRLSDIFNQNQGKEFAELPRMVFGLQLGMDQAK